MVCVAGVGAEGGVAAGALDPLPVEPVLVLGFEVVGFDEALSSELTAASESLGVWLVDGLDMSSDVAKDSA